MGRRAKAKAVVKDVVRSRKIRRKEIDKKRKQLTLNISQNNMKIMKDHWDKNLTVEQNYKKLGLIYNLSKFGDLGQKKNPEFLERMLNNPDLNDQEKDQILLDFFGESHGIVKRDSEGNIINVITKDATEEIHPLDKTFHDVPPLTKPLQDFETLAKSFPQSRPYKPFMKNKQRKEAQQWIQAYGTDYKKCSYDLELNPWQYTEDKIKKICEDYLILCEYMKSQTKK